MKNNTDILQILGLGIISGMRATFAPALAAHFFSIKPNAALAKSKLRFIQSPTAAIVTKIMAAAEITGDKLPHTPSRTIPPQVIARVFSGAFAGAVLSIANKDNAVKGIFIGGATALAATFATYRIRKYVSKNTFIKEPVTGAFEDAFAVETGILLLS